MNYENKLILISGASRGIGKAFMDYYLLQPATKCLGISKSKEGENYAKLDLFDKDATRNFVNSLDFSEIERIVHIHSVGIDKFEPDANPHKDDDGDGIDDDVYATNVTAFRNIAEPLIGKIRLEHKYLTMVNIGSISDIFKVPFWQSFSTSKDMVRKYMKSNCNAQIKGVMLNISSTLDDEGRKYGRPFADTSYWQKADDLVKKSVKFIDNSNVQAGYIEADFFKFSPLYRSDYFTNLENLYKYWQKDMGFEGKQIPHGIII